MMIPHNDVNGVLGSAIPRAIAWIIALLLVGYAFLGKSFAYLHLPFRIPLYVGELALVLCAALAMLRPGMTLKTLKLPAILCYVVFALLGIALTLPNLDWFGIDAIRDAAIYYYGGFMILVACLPASRESIEKLLATYAKIAVLFLLWSPCAVAANIFLRDVLPNVPWATLPVISVRSGHMAIHGTAILIFIIAVPARGWLHRHPIGATLLCVAALIPTFGSRAAMLATLVALSFSLALTPVKNRRFVRVICTVLFVVVIIFVFNPSVKLPNRNREISPSSVVAGVMSIFTDKYAGAAWKDFEGTKAWRLAWWRTIVDETFMGPYFWRGRGFGENLAVSHHIAGFEMESGDRPLRSPHNSHLTILSRMGVPGLSLWIMLNLLLLGSMLRLRRFAVLHQDRFLEGVTTWLLCYWLMFVLVAATDVYLEGPQGGIWYWSFMGFALLIREAYEKGVLQSHHAGRGARF